MFVTIMNIISGTAKGKKILVPESAKPVKSIVIQSIFSTLGNTVKNKNCLDLFAGSGILGLEALSREAATCDFVDSNPEAIEHITTNIKNAGFERSAEAIKNDAGKFIRNTNKKYTLIFLDPPYDNPVTHILKTLYEIAKKNCVVVFPHGINQNLTDSINLFTKLKSRNFGKTVIDYYTLDK